MSNIYRDEYLTVDLDGMAKMMADPEFKHLKAEKARLKKEWNKLLAQKAAREAKQNKRKA